MPRDGTPAERLAAFRATFFDALARGTADEPVMAAIVDSITRRGTDPECFERFFDAMASDLTRTTWATWEDLRDGYMEGSAAVIGEMMLPVLEPLTPDAMGPARALGQRVPAHQLPARRRRGPRPRARLPAAGGPAPGTAPTPGCGRVTPQWRAMMAEQVARNRELYAEGRPRARRCCRRPRARCVGTALVLYSRILDRIEAADYDVFSGRIRVPNREKLSVAVRAVVGAMPSVSFAAAH